VPADRTNRRGHRVGIGAIEHDAEPCGAVKDGGRVTQRIAREWSDSFAGVLAERVERFPVPRQAGRVENHPISCCGDAVLDEIVEGHCMAGDREPLVALDRAGHQLG
jgi:hypothetical protein